MPRESIIGNIHEKNLADSKERQKKEKLRAKLEKWKNQGYVVSKLESALQEKLASDLDGEFQLFEKNMGELSVLKRQLEGIDDKDFSTDVKISRAKLNDPSRIWEIKSDIEKIQRSISKKNSDAEARLEKKRLEKEMAENLRRDEKHQKELDILKKKEERLACKLKSEEEKLHRKRDAEDLKIKKKMGKIEAKKNKAEMEKLQKETALKEEERRIKEAEMEAQRAELSMVEIAKEELAKEMENQQAERARLTADMDKISQDFQTLREKMNEVKTEGGSLASAHSLGGKSEHSKTPVQPPAPSKPSTADEWVLALEGWERKESKNTIQEMEQISDEDYMNLLQAVVLNKEARINCARLIEKWNNDRYFRWFPGDIIEVRISVVGGAYALCRMLAFGEIKMYMDHVRYFDPIVKLYNRPENQYHNFPSIKAEALEFDGDKIIKYFTEKDD